MAGLTVLDASILIALFDESDPHSADAETIVADSTGVLGIGSLTLAEAMVRPVADGNGELFEARLHVHGIKELTPPHDAAARLARLRHETRLKMPDCYVLHIALEHDATALAARDEPLREAAARYGLATP